MAIINKTGITNGGTIQAEHVTRAIDALSGGSTDTVVATGSFSGSMVGALTGTASFATSASRAISSSFATTASFALNAGSGGISNYLLPIHFATYSASTLVPSGTTYYFGLGHPAPKTTNPKFTMGTKVPVTGTIVSASVVVGHNDPGDSMLDFWDVGVYFIDTDTTASIRAMEVTDFNNTYVGVENIAVTASDFISGYVRPKVSAGTPPSSSTINMSLYIRVS